jgi:hypothetical protein
MSGRSKIHMLRMIARHFEMHAPEQLVQTLEKFAQEIEARRVDKRFRPKREEKLIEQQRTLFAMLPSSNAADRLKEAMLQRAYDLLWDGDGNGCDALLEFLPSNDVEALLQAWGEDFDDERPVKSRWYGDRKAA